MPPSAALRGGSRAGPILKAGAVGFERPPLHTRGDAVCIPSQFGGGISSSVWREPGPSAGLFSPPLVVPFDRFSDVRLVLQLVPDRMGGVLRIARLDCRLCSVAKRHGIAGLSALLRLPKVVEEKPALHLREAVFVAG